MDGKGVIGTFGGPRFVSVQFISPGGIERITKTPQSLKESGVFDGGVGGLVGLWSDPEAYIERAWRRIVIPLSVQEGYEVAIV